MAEPAPSSDPRAAAPQPTPLPYPPLMPPYYYPSPPPRSSNLVLVIVIIVIIAVVLPMVLSFVLYVMVSGLIGGPDGQRPVVTFSQVVLEPEAATFTVIGAAPSFAFSEYRATLQVNATVGLPSTVSTNFTITVTPEVYQVSLTDVGGGGTLTEGDQFRVFHAGGFLPGRTYSFLLLWNDGALVNSVQWLA